jgi:NAD(P)-dependent dehydrogenase (short-subunit alcohol dehydrogenase family)
MISKAMSTANGLVQATVNATPIGRFGFRRSGRLELTGKVVFITGAARGLGAEIAYQAHEQGASVVLVGRSLKPLERFAEKLGSRALALQADVTDLAALEAAVQQAVVAFGGIDVVVANAGIAPPSHTLLTIEPEAFERTVEVDLLGQWRTIRATLPAVIESGGHIVVVSSIYAFFNGALNASYAASKAGVEQLVRALRVEGAPYGVTAGVAYLGFIDTDLARDVFEQEHIDDARKTMPAFITRPMSVDAAARAVVVGVRRRSARVTAPGWVLPLLRVRGISTLVMDEVMVRNESLRDVIVRADMAAR